MRFNLFAANPATKRISAPIGAMKSGFSEELQGRREESFAVFGLLEMKKSRREGSENLKSLQRRGKKIKNASKPEEENGTKPPKHQSKAEKPHK